MTLAKRLKACRKELNFSQSVVAERTGIPQSGYSELESGVIKTSVYLGQIAELYGVTVAYLTDGTLPKEAGNLDPLLSELIQTIKRLPPADQDRALSHARWMLSERSKEK